MSKRTLSDYFSKNKNEDDNQPTTSKNTKKQTLKTVQFQLM